MQTQTGLCDNKPIYTCDQPLHRL